MHCCTAQRSRCCLFIAYLLFLKISHEQTVALGGAAARIGGGRFRGRGEIYCNRIARGIHQSFKRNLDLIFPFVQSLVLSGIKSNCKLLFFICQPVFYIACFFLEEGAQGALKRSLIPLDVVPCYFLLFILTSREKRLRNAETSSRQTILFLQKLSQHYKMLCFARGISLRAI